MKVTCDFENNTLPDIYGKYSNLSVKGNAVLSFPFQVEDLPKKTKTLAWTFVDYDAIPACGFAYIHWVVANVPANLTSIPEDLSRQDSHHIHGKNSLTSKFLTTDYSDINQDYIGPCPPDKDHIYTLTVYALDDELSLENGFYMNDLLHVIDDHLVGKAKLNLIGKF